MRTDCPLVQPTSRILFVIGDGDFKHNSGGHITMPTATPLFNALQRQGKTVCWVMEHSTSMCCSKCGEEMQQAVLHKQLPPTEDELKARAQSKQDRQIKRKAHSLVKLASKHIQPDNQQAVPLSIPLRLLPITQEEADMAIKFARIMPQLKGADRMVAKNYDAKNLIMAWGLRHCGHCDNIWCRDKNACINMHLRAMFYLGQPLKSSSSSSQTAEADARPEPRAELDSRGALLLETAKISDTVSHTEPVRFVFPLTEPARRVQAIPTRRLTKALDTQFRVVPLDVLVRQQQYKEAVHLVQVSLKKRRSDVKKTHPAVTHELVRAVLANKNKVAGSAGPAARVRLAHSLVDTMAANGNVIGTATVMELMEAYAAVGDAEAVADLAARVSTEPGQAARVSLCQSRAEIVAGRYQQGDRLVRQVLQDAQMGRAADATAEGVMRYTLQSYAITGDVRRLDDTLKVFRAQGCRLDEPTCAAMCRLYAARNDRAQVDKLVAGLRAEGGIPSPELWRVQIQAANRNLERLVTGTHDMFIDFVRPPRRGEVEGLDKQGPLMAQVSRKEIAKTLRAVRTFVPESIALFRQQIPAMMDRMRKECPELEAWMLSEEMVFLSLSNGGDAARERIWGTLGRCVSMFGNEAVSDAAARALARVMPPIDRPYSAQLEQLEKMIKKRNVSRAQTMATLARGFGDLGDFNSAKFLLAQCGVDTLDGFYGPYNDAVSDAEAKSAAAAAATSHAAASGGGDGGGDGGGKKAAASAAASAAAPVQHPKYKFKEVHRAGNLYALKAHGLLYEALVKHGKIEAALSYLNHVFQTKSHIPLPSAVKIVPAAIKHDEQVALMEAKRLAKSKGKGSTPERPERGQRPSMERLALEVLHRYFNRRGVAEEIEAIKARQRKIAKGRYEEIEQPEESYPEFMDDEEVADSNGSTHTTGVDNVARNNSESERDRE
nr:hypothetical protein HK105_001333 [Polyrhizophydium stewartii]